MVGSDLDRVLGTAVALANARGSTAEIEPLRDLETVEAFVREWVITEVRPLRASDALELRGLRKRLRTVFEAPDADTCKDRINDLLAGATVRPRVTEHDGLGLHIHYFLPGASITEHLRSDLGMALAQLLVAGEASRLKVCEAADCDQVFVDTSRNRSRRYCDSRRCGNRLNAAAYRARQRPGHTPTRGGEVPTQM